MKEGSEVPKGPVFPKWSDRAVRVCFAFALVGAVYYVILGAYAISPTTLNVGYQPVQPVPFSHKLHAGKLGLDCRYCHNTVERAAFAAIPPTDTCMNCHSMIRTKSPKLELVRQSHATGMPIHWVKVHDLPGYVYFNHSAHVERGIGCVSCHGRIDTMDRVYQAKPLNMAWCLRCHRNPAKFLRPKDEVTSMTWTPSEDQMALGKDLMKKYHIKTSTSCSTCHR